MFCETCGKQINDTSKFCPFCGSTINNTPGPQGYPQGNQQGAPGMQDFQQFTSGPQGYPQGNQQGAPGMQDFQQFTAGPQANQQGVPGMQDFQQFTSGPQSYQQTTPGPQVYPQTGAQVQQSGGGKKNTGGLVVAIISGAAALLLSIVLIFVLDVFHLKDKDNGTPSGSSENELAASSDEPKTEDTSEVSGKGAGKDAASEEPVTENTSEEVVEAPVPYGEMVGYTLSEPWTEIRTSGIPYLYDTSGTRLEVNADDYMPDYYYTEAIDKIAVTDPDENGNVTYVIKYHCRYEADFTASPTGDGNLFTWRLGAYTYDFSDYYTGKLLDSTFCRKNSGETPAANTLNWDNKEYGITILETAGYDNGEDMQYNEATGISHDYLTRYYVVYATVPQDYNGLVMSARKEYNAEISASLSGDGTQEGQEDKPILDLPRFGYTSNGDNGIFVRISDYAVPLTDELMADMLNISTFPSAAVFDWCMEDMKNSGTVTITGNYNSTSGIITSPDKIYGKWQYLQVYEPSNPGEDYYLKTGMADFITDGSNVTIYMVDYLLSESSGSWTANAGNYTETYSGTMTGDGSITFNIDSMYFAINRFESDGVYQYAVGELILPDGSKGKILLQRP